MRIKLELISDLCTSSGDTVSGIIDTEICYDENGIPYIPAKRVKGCLKEAALELKDALGNEFDEETFKKLFGKSGDDRSASLVISNGYIENYNNISKEIKMMKTSDKKYYYQKQFIVENYTSLRTNTRVDRETLTAEEDTLRITRVIDRGNTFYFDINDLDKQEKDFLEKVCKVFRRMGLARTRGLGEVKCSLDSASNTSGGISMLDQNKLNDQNIYTVKFHFQNISDLVISAVGGEGTLDYIPGSTIMGYFANSYIQKKKMDKQKAYKDKNFNELFISGKVIFSNAYISDETGNTYLPCPRTVVKQKDGEKVYNKASDNIEEQVRNMDATYISFQPNGAHYKKQTEKAVHFHHQRPKDRSIGHATENEGVFFQYETIKEGQYFVSSITATGANLKKLLDTIPNNKTISVGKSRSSQYGNLKIIKTEITNNTPLTLKNNQEYVLALTSALINTNENNDYTSTVQQLKTELEPIIGKFEIMGTYLKFAETSVYNAVSKTSSVRYNTLDRSTAIKIKMNQDKTINTDTLWAGLMNNMGFGQIKVLSADMGNIQLINYEPSPAANPQINFTQSIYKTIQEKTVISHIKVIAASEASKKAKTVNSTSVNQIIQFVKISQTYQEIMDKINTIKITDKKNECLSLIKEPGKFKTEVFEKLPIYQQLDPTLKTDINKFHMHYIKAYLMQIKYELRKVS